MQKCKFSLLIINIFCLFLCANLCSSRVGFFVCFGPKGGANDDLHLFSRGGHCGRTGQKLILQEGNHEDEESAVGPAEPGTGGGSGHTITAADDFQMGSHGQINLVKVEADGVTLENLQLVATAGQQTCLGHLGRRWGDPAQCGAGPQRRQDGDAAGQQQFQRDH